MSQYNVKVPYICSHLDTLLKKCIRGQTNVCLFFYSLFLFLQDSSAFIVDIRTSVEEGNDFYHRSYLFVVLVLRLFICTFQNISKKFCLCEKIRCTVDEISVNAAKHTAKRHNFFWRIRTRTSLILPFKIV